MKSQQNVADCAIDTIQMLVDREEQHSVVRGSSSSRLRSRLFSYSAVQCVLVFLLFLAAVLALQVVSGAYGAEFGGYPDEPAHYITSLMLHDYVVGLHWTNPLQFAQHYYDHYPKVALGHWPPFFYVVQAIWMLVFSISRTSIRIQVAVTAAVLAYSVYIQARKWFGGRIAPVLAGLLSVAIPIVQTCMDEEMAEILLTVVCFWAAVYFAEFLDTESWRDAIVFGLFFSLAVLTKGSGWLLAGVVPCGVLLTRKFHIFLRKRFWASVLMVAILCLPWQILTLHMAEQGWTNGDKPSISYTLHALATFGLILLHIAGYPLGALALIGIITAVVIPMFRHPVRTAPAVLFGLIASDWVFHSLVPAGVENRKIVMAVPALVLFVFAGGYWVAGRVQSVSGMGRWRNELLAFAGALTFAFTGFAIPRQVHFGYDEAARFIAAQQKKILVSDDGLGEGLMISEIAMRECRPGSTILRGTKLLADMNWNGSQYRTRFSTPAELIAAIRAEHVDLVVTGFFPGFPFYTHNGLLRQALQDTGEFELVRRFRGASLKGPGEVLVYKVRRNFRPDATLMGSLASQRPLPPLVFPS